MKGKKKVHEPPKKAPPSLEEIKKEAAERKAKQLALEEAAKEERRQKAKNKMAEQMAGFSGDGFAEVAEEVAMDIQTAVKAPVQAVDVDSGSSGDLKWMEEDANRRAFEKKLTKKKEEEERKERSAILWQQQEAERKAKREGKLKAASAGLDDWGAMDEVFYLHLPSRLILTFFQPN